ncbi:MAG: Zinc transporter [Rhodocyclaceae bacterium]|nr:Zinc transporter [Rhodocyclaceae bacterium]
MSTLAWIITVALAGGLLSVVAAAGITYVMGVAGVSVLISYAIGALLGAVFLEILPHGLEHVGDAHRMAGTILFGILAFFVLEKLVLWRHCHHDQCEAHDLQPAGHDHGRSGLLILIGDTFHNFVDGILIAAAFLEDTQLGIVTALAIIAHEIPQEVGDYLILLHSGYSRARALAFNLLSSLATLIGALLAYFALSQLQEWIPAMLGLAAASMIYVAVADLIPGLHKRTELRATVQQVALIALGVGSIAVARALIGE